MSDKEIEMLSMSDKEFLQILRDQKATPDEWYYTEFNEVEGLGICKFVERYGGEGKGEEYFVTIHFPEVDKYVHAYADYYSYNGVDNWSDWTIVRPKQITKTIYV